MKVENNKIIEATEDELFDYYLKHDIDSCFAFQEYLIAMKRAGVKIADKRYDNKCRFE